MKSTKTNWPVRGASCVLACGLALPGCGGTKITKTDGSNSAARDSAGPISDAIIPDTPMATGGSGGTFGYDGPANLGGSGGASLGGNSGAGSSGAAGIDADTSTSDAALGSAGGSARPDGGGGAGGVLIALDGGGGFGSGGITGKGGSGGTGGLSDRGGAGGNGGSGGSAVKQDASDATWWANDAGIKTCPTDIGGYPKCDVGGPSIYVIGGTYDTYQCNQYGVWARQPDSCPGLLVDGDTCMGQFTCLYPSYWYCDCSGGMGFPAKCGDVRDLGLLDPRDASVPIDAPPPLPILPCPSGVETSACGYSTEHYCSQPTGNELCQCVSGAWRCFGAPCPGSVNRSTPCDTTDIRCRGDDGSACACFVDGFFMCGYY
jgi:hypothetical protein